MTVDSQIGHTAQASSLLAGQDRLRAAQITQIYSQSLLLVVSAGLRAEA
jgi:hypothetical protein